VMIVFIWSRYRIALHQRERELAPPEALAAEPQSRTPAAGALR